MTSIMGFKPSESASDFGFIIVIKVVIFLS